MPTHGKRGALPRENFAVPTLEAFITDVSALPSAPVVVDYGSGVTYPMYDNDRFGCCTVAGMFHALASQTAYAGLTPGGVQFTDAEVIKTYQAVCPGFNPVNDQNDNGATLMSVCRYGTTKGFTDTSGKNHKLAAVAEIGDPTNLPLLKKVLYTFGTVYLAFNLPESAENQFDENLPFTYVSGSQSAGGHCMVMELSSVGPNAHMNDESLVTWGKLVKCNQAFMTHTCVEGIAIATEDWISRNGTSVSGLNLSGLVNATRNIH